MFTKRRTKGRAGLWCAAVLLTCAGVAGTANAIPGFDVRAYNVIPGGGSNDHDLNDVGESLAIWSQIDNGVGTGTHTIGGRTYNIDNIHQANLGGAIDFHPGNAGNLGPNRPYSDIAGGAGLGGDDFSVRALASVTFAPGTYSISIGSDDGRYLRLKGITFDSVSGQGGTQQIAPDAFMRSDPTGHSQSFGHFTVAVPTVATLDAHFYERGGGDSIEIGIASGTTSSIGDFVQLSDGALAGAVSVDSNVSLKAVASANPGFMVSAFNIVGGGGSTDNDLNNLTETRAIWAHLDANPGFTGTTPSINGQVYNVQNNHQGVMATEIDYAGGGGNFPLNNPYTDINGGAGLGGDDFSIRAQTFLGVPEGTWTIAVASDDGRILILQNEDGDFMFSSAGDQTDVGGAGTNMIGREAPTGHNQSVGTFSIGAADLDFGDLAVLSLDALFYERGGGDSFEISIAPGTHTDFNDTFMLLEDGIFGWRVSKDKLAIPEPATGLLGLLAMAALGRRKRRIA